MTNGRLFRKVMANTPGGVLAQTTHGQPPIFVSAGLQDTIFPINQGANPVCHTPLASVLMYSNSVTTL